MASQASCVVVDDTFGPYAGNCRGGFDFTLLFEETILSLLPLALLLLLAPVRILYLLKKKVKVSRSSLLILKQALYLVYEIFQLALLVLWVKADTYRTRTSIANAAFCLIGACCLAVLSFAEHQRTIRPSHILNVYLLGSLIFDAAHVRTLWLGSFDGGITALSTVSIGVKSVLVVAESLGKAPLLRDQSLASSPEATSGIYGRAVFWWLNPLFRAGLSKTLAIEDLPALDKHLTSDYLYNTLQAAWKTVAVKKKHALLFTVFSKFKWRLLSVVPPRLALIGLTFCQPFLVNRAIQLVESPITYESTNAGYGMIGAYFIVYVGIAISMGQYYHLVYRGITMARGGLISMLFAKISSLKVDAIDPAASVTLMSADIERVTQGWQTMHEIWANTIEIGLAIYLLELQLGAACAIPIAVALVSFLGSLVATNLVVQRQALWLKAIERRISATSIMLNSMKRVKMCGLTDVLTENIHSLRLEEMQVSKKFRALLIWNLSISYIAPIFAPILTFAVFSILALRSNGSTTLTTSQVFTSLSLFALLSEPLTSLIMAMTMFAGSVGSFDRIQDFLESPSHIDQRIQPTKLIEDSLESSEHNTSSSASESGFEKSELRISKLEKGIFLNAGSEENMVSIDGGRFGWDAGMKPLLHSINISIPKSKLTIVVGPVGCGKTTLIKAILGEIPALSGTVKISSTEVAYCDQTPFHMNGTIRDSILAGEKYNERWYKSVIKACALDDDLQQLVLGDRTRIGSNGIAISGGQSQRLALARAVYSRKDVYLLDNVFSGLDLDTESSVFHNLLGLNGLLRLQQATVFLASSAAKRLPFADHIIILDKNGSVSEQGSFKELNAQGGYVSSFNLQSAEWKHGIQTQENYGLKEEHAALRIQSAARATGGDGSAEANRRIGDLSIYAYYARSVGWLATIIFFAAITVYVFCFSFPQIWLGWWANANVTAPNQNLGYWLGIYALLGVGAIAGLVMGCWQMVIAMVPISGASFHWKLLTTVLSAPMVFFSTVDSGVTLNRFSQDLQLIDMELPIALINFVLTLVLCIAQIVLIGVSSPFAAVSFPFWFLSLYLIQRFYLRTSRQLRFLDLEAKSPLYSQFTEMLSGLVTVRAFGWQRGLEKKNRQMLDQSQRPFYLLFAVQRWLQVVLDLLVAAVAVMLISLATQLRGRLSATYVGVALLNVILFSQYLKYLLQFWTMLETHIGAIARIKIFSNETASENLRSEDGTLPPAWPSRGALEFSSVIASYDRTHPVLKDLSFSIKAGQKIGICGRSGSGKSSLVMAIFRMIELNSGTITVDGVDISTIPREEIRSRIVGLPQDAFFLAGTVRLNADPYKRVSDEVIVAALKDVKLWDVIQEKGGLAAKMDSINLSHGQRQLFCLAQALLRPCSILILDEATSSVDDATDGLMQKVIRKKFMNHTIIAVAHKLETIMDFDKVIVLGDGALIEFDGPHELLEKSESAFRRLYLNASPSEKI